MEIYHTATREDYDALMIEFEEKCYKWGSGDKPTEFKHFWSNYKEHTVVILHEDKTLTYAELSCAKDDYSNITIIEYKARGNDKMPEKECTKCHEKRSKKAIYCQICGNKLVEKPMFEVGNYVTDNSDNDPFICEVKKIEEGEAYGKWYATINRYFDNRFSSFYKDCRLATPEEITEYKAALNFHEHGRKPFELKKGDLLRDEDDRELFFVEQPCYLTKEKILFNSYKLEKTAEELDEWLNK